MFGHWFCAFAGYMFMFIFPFGFFNTHKAFVWNCMWPKKRQAMYFQSRRSPLKNSINHKEKFVKISEFQKPHKNAHCVFISAPLGTPAIELKKSVSSACLQTWLFLIAWRNLYRFLLLLFPIMDSENKSVSTDSTKKVESEEPKKLKPCCACPETKQVRDKW